jgi:hypothetical protein
MKNDNLKLKMSGKIVGSLSRREVGNFTFYTVIFHFDF